MLTEKQLAIRRTGITATDMRAIVGLDPYGRTAHDVWCDKRGLNEGVRDAEWLGLGDELEPIVIRRLAKKRGLFALAIPADDMTRVHLLSKTHIATPDAFFCTDGSRPANDDGWDPALIDGIDSIGQAKVVSPFHAEGWGKSETEIPDWCLVQVQWELHVTGLPLEHVGALIWPGIRTYKVHADAEMQGLLGEEADRFWTDHVVTNRPPEVDGSEGSARMLGRLFPASNGARFKASPQVEELARNFFETKRGLAKAEAEHEQVRQLLQLACGEAEGIDGDGWRLNYRTQPAYDVAPKPYHVDAKRKFDLREKVR